MVTAQICKTEKFLRHFCIIFLYGPTPASFCLFSFASNTNFIEINCRLERDSNSDRQSKSRAR